ncbi:MAG: RecQ family ATP-dependent DNA helicase [Blautia sp.]|nr:RecQ family ATP-dependent DNA helicase [Blautia sp.]
MNSIVFVDTEVSPASKEVLDYGAAFDRRIQIHTGSRKAFTEFISRNRSGDICYACGHNIVHHDAGYIGGDLIAAGVAELIDTLYLSPLLFPNKPYHALVKDDKLLTDAQNNPLNDAIKAMELFYDEVNAFAQLDEVQKDIYAGLLCQKEEFQGFFSYVGYSPKGDAADEICQYYHGKICDYCDVEVLRILYPVELAYALAMLSAEDQTSIIPPWVNRNYPAVQTVIAKLRNTPCGHCSYCERELNIHKKLKRIFGYDSFRTYDGEKLQEEAAQAAVKNESLLAIFPTGGGKSVTFQLPALIAGEAARALTVVISPLQSLMKDQVDNLEKRGIADAVAINGLLSPIERAEAIERVESGLATILYISPESLRSYTVERLLLKRSIARFVIDEAHCFSAWGQDFRVDYLYIGDFIRELQEKKRTGQPIPVSCFTATAKQKVISDIREYFQEKLNLDLKLYASKASRKNLRYEVLFRETDEQKYLTLRMLIEQKNCPTIVYASRTGKTEQLAKKLRDDGFYALAFHGKMEKDEKLENQEAFIRDQVQVMVATSAFGMGVDKPNVKLVIHYDISDSLENYMQEAGRAGRDESLQAECYVLYNSNDLDKHFIMLNQTRLSIHEIQQIWKAVKDLTRLRPEVWCTAYELARQAGWDERTPEIDTRAHTAIQALENAGYLKRGKNSPKVFADSILVPGMLEASAQIDASPRIADADKLNARRIVEKLISARSRAKGSKGGGESRVDYIADQLGMTRFDTFRLVQLLREEKILADTKDLTAYIQAADKENKSAAVMRKYTDIEEFLVKNLAPGGQCINLKELNDAAVNSGVKSSSVNAIKTIFYYWTIRKYIKKSIENTTEKTIIMPELSWEELWQKRTECNRIADCIIKYLFQKYTEDPEAKAHGLVLFSLLELKEEYKRSSGHEATNVQTEDALLYLSKIGALRLEGGFLVLYSGMQIKRLQLDNKIRYKAEDYKQLDAFYKQKMQQIHIVGEFANMMLQNYDDALTFVNDYFYMNYKAFIAKYFKGNRKDEINRNITPEKYNRLFDGLSDAQREIIDDDKSKYIVVAAGPGSGKTKVLVHKLASLIMLEEVKHEQLLMVTFSRAAATEFKKRLYDLIGNAAAYVEIKTFHSYCFDLLGRIGDLDSSQTVVQDAAAMIAGGEVELGRITKNVLVIDEAQDMSAQEFALVSALIEKNDDLRVIAVGDDDQNIYEFRGSSSAHFKSFLEREDAKMYELLDNYRSDQNIVAFSNAFVKTIGNRLKNKPILAKRQEPGEVELVKCRSCNLEEPVTEKARALCQRAGDSVCILTGKNEEALQVMGLLKYKGVRARLIQGNDRFDLCRMLELTYFKQRLEKNLHSPLISEREWEEAREDLRRRYADSENLPLCLNLLDAFAIAYPKKYKSDFDIFLQESRLEDFFSSEESEVVVSTIHKAKGREFDRVVMLLGSYGADTNEAKRALYVGMTRAKHGLYIYYNGNVLDAFPATGQDDNNYEKPGELLVQLSHKDVNLGFFKDKKEIIRRLWGGAKLNPEEDGLSISFGSGRHKIVVFSKRFLEDVIEKNRARGYVMAGGKIRFVLGWTDQKEGREYPVVLPDIYLIKKR